MAAAQPHLTHVWHAHELAPRRHPLWAVRTDFDERAVHRSLVHIRAINPEPKTKRLAMRVEKLRFVPSGAAMNGAASAAVAAVLHVGQTHKGAKHQPKRVSHVCGDVLDRMHHVANGP
jgi:hypothetical protein